MERLGPIQENYQEKLKIKVLKQIVILDKPDFSEEQFNEMIENNELELPIFDDGFMSSQRSKQKLDEIETRRLEMKKLENSIIEVHDLFVQVASLVDEQGAKTENILHQVSLAEVTTERALNDVKKTAVYAEKARAKQRMCWAIMIFGGIILCFWLYFQMKGFADGSYLYSILALIFVVLMLILWCKWKMRSMVSFRR
jgi:syntaxin 1B/2/3